jgi:hypothetical protein
MSSPTISKVAMAQKKARPIICHWSSAKNDSSKTMGCTDRFNYHKIYKISKFW